MTRSPVFSVLTLGTWQVIWSRIKGVTLGLNMAVTWSGERSTQTGRWASLSRLTCSDSENVDADVEGDFGSAVVQKRLGPASDDENVGDTADVHAPHNHIVTAGSRVREVSDEERKEVREELERRIGSVLLSR